MVSRLTLFSIGLLSLLWLRRYLLSHTQQTFHTLMTLIFSAVLFNMFEVLGGDMMRFSSWSAHTAVLNGPFSYTDRLDMLMLVSAVVWLLYRALQVIFKPVPELIEILNIDIPQAPDVCLTGIRSDAASLAWTRPSPHRQVSKYLFQVNGVQVGEAPGNEEAITVIGLRPNHFYNIRVFAVGHNKFRTGSRIIRLRTFGKDGRPQLGNSRLPTSFIEPDRPRQDTNKEDAYEELGNSLPTVEATPDSLTPRDPNWTVPGQRRNTLNRRQLQAVPIADQIRAKTSASQEPELLLPELNERFENVRREIDTTLQLISKEQNEAVQQEEELKRERDRKRQMLKEKEEHTTQLRATIRSTMEQMRVAEKEKQKKEQQLKDKEDEKALTRDGVIRLEKELERMRKEREEFDARRKTLEKTRDRTLAELDAGNAELQEHCAALEAELKDKGRQLQDLKASREKLPGDDEWKEEDLRLRRDWDTTRKELHERLVTEQKQGHQLDNQIRILSQKLSAQQQQAGKTFYNSSSSAALDYDPSTGPQSASKRSSTLGTGGGGGSGNTTLSSPSLAHVEHNLLGQSSPAQAGYGQGLFIDMPPNTDGTMQSEADFKAAGGPLSPSAQTYLPSNIFDDAESEDEKKLSISGLTDPGKADEQGPGSPVSPPSSYSPFSNQQVSKHNLTFLPYGDASERLPAEIGASPMAPPSNSRGLSSLLQSFQRRTPKNSEDCGPLIGSLKHSQSQSFPRGNDVTESPDSRWKYLRRTFRTPAETQTDTRRVDPLLSSRISAISDLEQARTKTPSIHSMDRARPSTDSSSIWGAPSDVSGALNRMWSPNDNVWPSRSGSRRPSVHGSTTALTTTLASADDKILEQHELKNPQVSASHIGVIGSRPPGSAGFSSPSPPQSAGQRLNPAAPTFMNIFQKDKDRNKDRGRDKKKDDKGKAKMSSTPSVEAPHGQDDSASDPRMSRDTYSVHTGTSVSESRESLQLEATDSNTPSDMNSASASNMKESENVVRKLFRKGSSGKFSLTSRLGKESALFKKGSGNASNPDRLMSAEQRPSMGDADDVAEDAALFGRSYDSMTSSPSLGPSRSRDSKDGRMSWRFSIKKRSKDASIKERDSLDLDLAAD